MILYHHECHTSTLDDELLLRIEKKIAVYFYHLAAGLALCDHMTYKTPLPWARENEVWKVTRQEVHLWCLW